MRLIGDLMALETPGAVIIRATGLKITRKRESSAVYRLSLFIPIETKTHYVMWPRAMPYYKNLNFKSHYKIIIIIINLSKI